MASRSAMMPWWPVAVVAVKGAAADLHGAVAIGGGGVGRQPAAAQAGQRGDEFERGTGRVDAADRPVGPGFTRVDALGGSGAQARRELVQVIVGLARQYEHFACAHIEGNRRPLEIADLLHLVLGGELQVDVEARIKVVTLHGRALFLGRLTRKPAGSTR